jgi:hypothetical protein
MFGWKFRRIKPQPSKELRITEGIAGYWHYHFSRADDTPTKSLCGKPVMYTSIPLDQWRVPFGEHFPKRPTWCDDCEQMRKDGAE